LGDRNSLVPQITAITGIPLEALQGRSLSQFSIKARMSWLGERQTKREEDRAYCLFGILDVQMAPLYGEGQSIAFRRLRKEIETIHKPQPAMVPQEVFTDSKNRHSSLNSTTSHSRRSGLLKRSDIPTLQNVYMNTIDCNDTFEESRVATYPATSERIAFAKKPSFPEKQKRHQTGRSLPKSTRDGFVGALSHRGILQDATNVLSSHLTSTDATADSRLQFGSLNERSNGIMSHLNDKQN
jgi:hypothetical protein